MNPSMNNGIPEVTPEEVIESIGHVEIIDVRRPEEFNDQLGHIETAKLVTLGPDLVQFLQTADKSKEIVFVCRSGGRSGQATIMSREAGFQKTYNMTGGMLLWNQKDLPKE